ncbi:hypothetical protein [Faecalispora anaeroviscerum]|uniref:hypothetical protein n=1 Tax=Faecalispora anaeroviscerum TaxID=2991836 RepID=UPI0024B8EEDB|nr:hypothetical protein [Faecalispora anaeroviscerum]
MAVGISSPALANSEQASAVKTLARVTLPENTSYISDIYSGILRLKSDDETIAVASIDSQNRVVISAISEGDTTVSYWYQTSVESGWISVSVPITVSGQSQTSASIDASKIGLTFTSTVPLSIQKGMTSSVAGIQKNGISIAANTLLWVSSNEAVAQVTSNTGEIIAVGQGTAIIYAVDPTDKYCASIGVQVT